MLGSLISVAAQTARRGPLIGYCNRARALVVSRIRAQRNAIHVGTRRHHATGRVAAAVPAQLPLSTFAHTRAHGQATPRQIEDLQLRRTEFSNAEYIQQLQALILESARINEAIEQLSSE